MARYIRIRNWDRYQYRTDKPLPWIKDYDAQLGDPEYTGLSFAERGFLHDLRLLANRRGNKILNDPGYVRRMLGGRGPNADRMLTTLTQKGFLEEWDPATEPAANTDSTGALGADAGRTQGAPDVDVDVDIPLPPSSKPHKPNRRNGRAGGRGAAFTLAEALIRNGGYQLTDASLLDELHDRHIPEIDHEPLLELAHQLRGEA